MNFENLMNVVVGTIPAILGFSLYDYWKFKKATNKYTDERVDAEDTATGWIPVIKKLCVIQSRKITMDDLLELRNCLGSVPVTFEFDTSGLPLRFMLRRFIIWFRRKGLESWDANPFKSYEEFKNTAMVAVNIIYSNHYHDMTRLDESEGEIVRLIARQLKQDRWNYKKMMNVEKEMFLFARIRIHFLIGTKGKLINLYVQKNMKERLNVSKLIEEKLLESNKNSVKIVVNFK